MESKHPDIIRNFSIISRYSRRYIHHRIKQEGYNLGHSQARFMMLMAHGYRGKRQDDFKKALKKDKTTVARAMAKLEEADLIRRETDPDDHRAYRIYPTKKAEGILQQIDNIMIDLNNLLIKDLTNEERKTLLTLLKKMEQNITSIQKRDSCTDCYHPPNKGEVPQ